MTLLALSFIPYLYFFPTPHLVAKWPVWLTTFAYTPLSFLLSLTISFAYYYQKWRRATKQHKVTKIKKLEIGKCKRGAMERVKDSVKIAVQKPKPIALRFPALPLPRGRKPGINASHGIDVLWDAEAEQSESATVTVVPVSFV